MRGLASGEGFADPLGVLYLVARASGREVDEQMVEVAAFCFFYLCAGDLMDDVEDADLVGKPHERAGSAVAFNNAVTLLLLALARLRRAAELEPDRELAARYYRLFERISLTGVAGQHRDLLPPARPLSSDELLAIHRDKTSCIGLTVECGALLGRCDEVQAEGYRRIGERLSELVQIVDDLRDIYGGSVSPDLATEKLTYPLACLRECADGTTLERLRALSAELPQSLELLRHLFHDAGAVARCADKLDELRRAIHREVAALDNPCGAHRTLLGVVDLLSSTVYEPEPVAESAALFRPRGGFHDAVRAELETFLARMAPFAPPEAPALEPWAQPQYLYEPARGVVYYPDLEDLRDEILPYQAALLGSDDLDATEAALKGQLSTVLAHELFHYWRHQAGRLTEDSWHEEFAANRLAVSYAKTFCPDVLEGALKLRDTVFARLGHLLTDQGEQVLSRCHEAAPRALGYEMDWQSTAVVQLELVRRLAAAPADLERDVTALLTPAA